MLLSPEPSLRFNSFAHFLRAHTFRWCVVLVSWPGYFTISFTTVLVFGLAQALKEALNNLMRQANSYQTAENSWYFKRTSNGAIHLHNAIRQHTDRERASERAREWIYRLKSFAQVVNRTDEPFHSLCLSLPSLLLSLFLPPFSLPEEIPEEWD